MSEQLKYIISELNLEPFNRSYNLILFDSLTGEQLLQILSDVLSEIESKGKLDIREEEPENTILRILGMLRLLKYKPPMEIAQNFRPGLLEGKKLVLYPLLEWLLQRKSELKKRTYLAKYLVKVEVPPEVAADSDVAELYEQYEHLIANFKGRHKELEVIKNSGYSTAELRKDIEEMEDEKETVAKRIERMQRKMDGVPNAESMLRQVQRLRTEREQEKELLEQKQEQRTALQHAEQRIQRLEAQLKDLRQASTGATPEGLLQKIEEETNVNKYIVTQKLPKEIESKKRIVESFSRVTNMPAMGQDDLRDLKDKIKGVLAEANELNEKRNVVRDPIEDKLTLFRQQAAIISRKKDSTAEKLSDTRSDVQYMMEELEEKREQVKSFAGETILRGDDFKRYVNSLRDKSALYKKKKSEMSELRAEYGILQRTVEILMQRTQAVHQTLATMEREKGVSGFRDTQDNLEKVATTKADLDMQKGATLEEMSGLVNQLTNKIGERKARLAPIIKELRPLRQQCQDMQVDYDERKHTYDTLLLQLESSMSRLEQAVKKGQEEIITNESIAHKLELETELLELYLKRAQEEMQMYVHSKDPDVKAKTSVRDQLLKQISEQEKRGKQLKEDQKKVKDMAGNSSKQVKLWGNTARLFEVKRKCMASQQETEDSIIHREPGTETMVL